MTGKMINAGNKALESHELSFEELNAVSGGRRDKDNARQLETLKTFVKVIASA